MLQRPNGMPSATKSIVLVEQRTTKHCSFVPHYLLNKLSHSRKDKLITQLFEEGIDPTMNTNGVFSNYRVCHDSTRVFSPLPEVTRRQPTRHCMARSNTKGSNGPWHRMRNNDGDT